MKIVIAPDSFKESLSALQVASAIEEGFRQAFPMADYAKVPMADGGEGTVQAMVDACGGDIVNLTVTCPLGSKISAFYGLLEGGHTAVIEIAAASGLHLVPNESRAPLLTHSYGSGELILDALNHGVSKIILGLGGSATIDGGVGMMIALGVGFYGKGGNAIKLGGQGLSELTSIDCSNIDERLKRVDFELACDVDNPLCGKNGASFVFGKQKGASPKVMKILDNNLANYAAQLKLHFDEDIINKAGAGAAGGMGAAALLFLDAKLRPGIDLVAETVNLAEIVKDADIVITGEGCIDSQTIHGKTPIGVAKIAKKAGCFVIGIAGSLSDEYEVVNQHGLDAVFNRP